jgi:hypothetical protein
MCAFALCPAAQQSLGLPYSAGKRDSLTARPPNSSAPAAAHTHLFTIDQGRSDLSLKSAFLSQKRSAADVSIAPRSALHEQLCQFVGNLSLFLLSAPAQISQNSRKKIVRTQRGTIVMGFIFNEKQKGWVFNFYPFFL